MLSERRMVVHVDYSKNYKNKQRNEIKEAYYGQNTFSIMPTHPEQAGVTRILKSSPTFKAVTFPHAFLPYQTCPLV